MAIYLAPFDPRRDFVAQTDFVCRGVNIAKGDSFDKSSVPVRTLRILYDGRSIGYTATEPTKPPRATTPVGMTDEDKALLMRKSKPALQKMVEDLHVTLDPEWTKAQLVAEIARARYGAANG